MTDFLGKTGRLVALGLGASLLFASPTFASPSSVQPEGEYGGVAPGVVPRAEREHAGKGKIKPPPKGTLTWIGFTAKDGTAEVFLQAAQPFTIDQHLEGGTLVVVANGLTRIANNTRRTVDTRFFNNPLAYISTKKVSAASAHKGMPAHAAGSEVFIQFKNPADAHEGVVRTATEADGLYYTYLTFAHGTGAGTKFGDDIEVDEPSRSRRGSAADREKSTEKPDPHQLQKDAADDPKASPGGD